MRIEAESADGRAILTVTTLSSSSELSIDDAHDLADDLDAFLSDPEADDHFGSSYAITAAGSGLKVSTKTGSFDLQWRWIIPVINDLRA
jgi:hypothetical protein